MFASVPFSGDTEFWKHQLSLLTFTTRLTSSFLSIPCRTELGLLETDILVAENNMPKQSRKHHAYWNNSA